jgi:hypothetical protein
LTYVSQVRDRPDAKAQLRLDAERSFPGALAV